MPQFLVQSAEVTKEIPNYKTFGPMKEISLILKEYGTEASQGATWFTKGNTTVPEPGATLEGDLTRSEYGLKFKKASQNGHGGGGDGGRAMNDEDRRRITRCHSQEMAVRWLEIKQRMGELPQGVKPEMLRSFIDWFDDDVYNPRKGRMDVGP